MTSKKPLILRKAGRLVTNIEYQKHYKVIIYKMLWKLKGQTQLVEMHQRHVSSQQWSWAQNSISGKEQEEVHNQRVKEHDTDGEL